LRLEGYQDKSEKGERGNKSVYRGEKKEGKIIRGHRQEAKKENLTRSELAVHCLLVGRKKIRARRCSILVLPVPYLAATVLCCLGGEKEGRKEGRRDASFGLPARHKTRQAGDIIPTLPAQLYNYLCARVAEASFLSCGGHSQLSPFL